MISSTETAGPSFSGTKSFGRSPVRVRDPDDRAFEHARVGGHPLDTQAGPVWPVRSHQVRHEGFRTALQTSPAAAA